MRPQKRPHEGPSGDKNDNMKKMMTEQFEVDLALPFQDLPVRDRISDKPAKPGPPGRRTSADVARSYYSMASTETAYAG